MERVFVDINAALPDDIVITKIQNQFHSRGVVPRFKDVLRARRLRGQVNHVVGDVHYLTAFLPRQRTILTIHDCEMIDRNRGLKRWFLKLLWLDMPVRLVGTVVAISERTRDDIVRLSGVDPAHIRIIDNPVSARFKPASPPPDNSPVTALHIGTKANKNLERLIEASQGLALKLLIVGHLSEPQRALLEKADVSFELFSNLSDDEMQAMYVKATFLSFVSLSEGFGLPIVEAQAVGRPVLTANREPMMSVASPDGALFVDPDDVTSIRQGLERLAFDKALRGQLVAAGERNVKRFDAGTVAARYAELYREVATA